MVFFILPVLLPSLAIILAHGIFLVESFSFYQLHGQLQPTYHQGNHIHDDSFILENYKTSNTRLFMAADPAKQDLTGKVVAQRYIYRFSPSKSPVTTPYSLEERQYYTVAEDRSLEPFGDKCFIFRDGEAKDDGVNPPEGSLKKNGMPRVYTRIGKALYTVNNLQEEEEEEGIGGSVWESSYVMALYCMEHPEMLTGKCMEVGR